MYPVRITGAKVEISRLKHMPMTQSDKHTRLKSIRDRIWDLKESPLYEYRMQNKYYCVIGEGNHDANIMFIGEAPGKNEAQTGRPFCGAAGKFLDGLLQSINLNRNDVYITNIVKDRPPENRDPTVAEIELYSPFLKEQIDIIQPKVIATLGRFSMKYILELFDLPEQSLTIGKLHGRVLKTTASYGEISLVPLYHPASALYNPNNRQVLKQDFQTLTLFA